MKNAKVLLIGDSFGYIESNPEVNKPATWLSILTKKYNWNVINQCVPGSGPIYLVDQFFNLHSQHKLNFDLCIFLWSEPFRNLKPGDPRLVQSGSGNSIDWANEEEYIPCPDQTKAINLYQLHLWDKHGRYDNLIMSSLCLYIDSLIQKHYNTVKFWHLHSFPCYDKGKEGLIYAKNINNQKHYHYFKHGVNITPSLAYYSMIDHIYKSEKQLIKRMSRDKREGHLTDRVHQFIGNRLISLCKLEYENGSYFSLDERSKNKQIEVGPYSIDYENKL